MSKVQKEECQELNNIEYKTMLLNGNKKNLSTVINDISNIDLLLDQENELNKKESWNKLDKSIKMNKISEYIKILTCKVAPFKIVQDKNKRKIIVRRNNEVLPALSKNDNFDDNLRREK